MDASSSFADILAWRAAERRRLIQRRLALDPDTRRDRAAGIAEGLTRLIGTPRGRIIGVYWPVRGEPDLRPWSAAILRSGGRCALPVVVEKNAPLVFRIWSPDAPMARDAWNIPVPAGGEEVVPDILLAPVAGFDRACFRLGYGGGFFDRTLAVLSPRPLVIGVGHAAAEIATIHPLPHDIPMDAIVTERETIRRSAA
jgi:5,10-methenyltetrahydrofolate synthetase